MNYNTRLVSHYIRRQINQRPVKNILNLSEIPINFNERNCLNSEIPTEHFFCKNLNKDLPFPNHSFDFVYVNKPLDIFTRPSHMYSELMRVAKSGLIRNISPLGVYLKNFQPRYITWTDTLSNSLCFMVYHEQMNIDVGDMDKTCLNRPYFLSDWYAWTSTNDFNIKIFTKEDNFADYPNYELILYEAMEESAKNTYYTIMNK